MQAYDEFQDNWNESWNAEDQLFDPNAYCFPFPVKIYSISTTIINNAKQLEADRWKRNKNFLKLYSHRSFDQGCNIL